MGFICFYMLIVDDSGNSWCWRDFMNGIQTSKHHGKKTKGISYDSINQCLHPQWWTMVIWPSNMRGWPLFHGGCGDIWGLYGICVEYVHTHMYIYVYVYIYICKQHHAWVDGWMGGWVDGWVDGWMNVCMYECMDVCMYVCVYMYVCM